MVRREVMWARNVGKKKWMGGGSGHYEDTTRNLKTAYLAWGDLSKIRANCMI